MSCHNAGPYAPPHAHTRLPANYARFRSPISTRAWRRRITEKVVSAACGGERGEEGEGNTYVPLRGHGPQAVQLKRRHFQYAVRSTQLLLSVDTPGSITALPESASDLETTVWDHPGAWIALTQPFTQRWAHDILSPAYCVILCVVLRQTVGPHGVPRSRSPP